MHHAVLLSEVGLRDDLDVTAVADPVHGDRTELAAQVESVEAVSSVARADQVRYVGAADAVAGRFDIGRVEHRLEQGG